MRVILAALLAALFFGYRALTSAALDGSVWGVRMRAKAVFALPKKDTLVFDRGRFTSTRHLSSGYLPAGYAALDQAGDRRSFSSSLLRGDGNVLDWSGEVRGDRMKGTVLLTRADGRRTRYSFRGRRQESPPPTATYWRRRLAALWQRYS
ncbi:MAG: hypothetical protein ABIJ96_10795 [Elusimicrobiota bacterium]